MESHPADVRDPQNTPVFADLGDDAAPAERYVPAALFAGIAVLIGVDVAVDLLAGVNREHVWFEAIIFAVASGGLIWLARRIGRMRSLARELRRDLARARADSARWRAESRSLIDGLGAAIDRQFADWSLTSAEREIGLLLLKGLSLKEVSDARGTSERTVRQQAFGLYRKAGVSGRAELSAFFLEDLLLPAR